MIKENVKYVENLRSKVFESLSDKTGLSAEHLKRFLSGSNDITTPEFLAIANAFKFNFDDLAV